MGGNNQKDFVVEIYCNYNKECQTVNSEIKNLYELSHTFFRLGDGYQRFWCFNKVPWWPCLPPKIDLSRGRQEMVYSWSCWCWREDPVMLGLCQAGGHRIPSLNLTRNFWNPPALRRLVWADTPGIDSLGDAQTIIQQNFLISFYCGRQFLSISNVELFVKTEDGFDWDKAIGAKEKDIFGHFLTLKPNRKSNSIIRPFCCRLPCSWWSSMPSTVDERICVSANAMVSPSQHLTWL